MFDPYGEESTDEFVELYNNSALPVQLAGWTISDGEGEDSLVSAGQGLFAAPNQYILIIDPDYIEDGSVTYDGLVPETALIVTIHTATFGSRGFSNSSSESVILKNASGNTVFSYRYSIGNESGHSDEKIRLSGTDDSTNWSNSVTLLGTPGFRNSVTPAQHDLAVVALSATPDFPAPRSRYLLEIVIANSGLQVASGEAALLADSTAGGNRYLIELHQTGMIAAGASEALMDSLLMPETGIHQLIVELTPTDDDTSNNTLTTVVSSEALATGIRINEIQYAPLAGRAEWVELAVAGTVPVSTRGMSICDGQGIADTTKRAPLPELVLLPGQFMVVSSDSAVMNETIPVGSPLAVILSTSFTLNNGGDSLAVFSANGETLERIDYRPNWGNSVNGVSLERVSLDAASNEPSNWGSCSDLSGSTPGRVNARSITTPISETTLSASPSPFTPNGDGTNDVTEIRFQTLEQSSSVAIKIFDIRGRLVRRLSGSASVGRGSVIWDGRRDNGSMAATARYIILLEAEIESGGIARERTTVILARPK